MTSSRPSSCPLGSCRRPRSTPLAQLLRGSLENLNPSTKDRPRQREIPNKTKGASDSQPG